MIAQNEKSATFELCPVFVSDYGIDPNRPSQDPSYNTYMYPDSNTTHDHNVHVSHGKGKVCYQTTIKKYVDKNTNFIYEKTTEGGI